ncbi:MAG: outer membrane protein assembly factor BamD [Candidatus Omnitrophica bacterium]|nr:outer membrane protein assembly factor BamD [Candidatus Omnitrophota bacterium]
MKSAKIISFLFVIFFVPVLNASAYWVWSPESGKFVNPEGAVQDTADDQFEYAMKFYREKDLDEAKKQLENLLKKYPAAAIAPEAEYRLGIIFEEKEEYKNAYKAYKKLIESYPQTDRFEEVIERLFRIGNLFLSGRKAKLMGLEILPSLSNAVEIFESITRFAPYSEYGDQAQFHLGLTYKKWKRFDEAMDAFQAVIDNYPQSDLIAQVRYQLAETSFERSSAQFRDQRALDEASQEVDRFLMRHPDATISENAEKLRQVIDEKNAQKNYQIGLYYEKQNYLQSALIYYRDVAERYPRTEWGEKAGAKLKSLESPADYMNQKKEEVLLKIETLESQVASPEIDQTQKKELEDQLRDLKKAEKNFEGEKEDVIKRREDDLKRREGELKEKFKALEEKRKSMKDKATDDFHRAMDRWHASLMEEQGQIEDEKVELSKLREELGVSQGFDLGFIPFVGEGPTPIEEIRNMDAKKMYKLAEKKKDLLEEKENLYKDHSEINVQIMETQVSKIGLDQKSDAGTQGTPGPLKANEIDRQQTKVNELRRELQNLEQELEDKQAVYKEHFGTSPWLSLVQAPVRMVSQSTGVVASSLNKSWSVLNPFDSDKIEEKDLDELLEYQMHLKEKIAAQTNLIQTLEESVDAQQVLDQQKEMTEALKEVDEESDPRELRKTIKQIEKEIRAGYQEIEDRHQHRKELLQHLETAMTEQQSSDSAAVKVGRAVTTPFVQSGRLMKAFIFGMPDKDVELTESADKVPATAFNAAKIQSIKEEVELESLLIESKSREIENAQKTLEIMKAKASLGGGYKFRASMVEVPYQFIGEAIEKARKMVPRDSRDEQIRKKLQEERQKAQDLRQELRDVQQRIDEKSEMKQQKAETVLETGRELITGEEATEEAGDFEEEYLKAEIEELQKRIKVQEEIFRHENDRLKRLERTLKKQAKQDRKDEDKTEASLDDEDEIERELHERLEDIEKAIVKLIERERELETEEVKILEKRINQIDQVIPSIKSKAMTQDLLTERERIETRLMQIEARQDFLVKELKRFQLTETTVVSS